MMDELLQNFMLDYSCEQPDLTFIFCDIDGVFAGIKHRLHYLNAQDGEKKDYDKFYGIDMAKDTPLSVTAMVAESIIMRAMLNKDAGHNVIVNFVTGRPQKTIPITNLWLSRYYPNLFNLLTNNGLSPFLPILARRDDDHRKAPAVKKEIVKAVVKERLEDIDSANGTSPKAIIIDDDPVVALEMEKGVLEGCDEAVLNNSYDDGAPLMDSTDVCSVVVGNEMLGIRLNGFLPSISCGRGTEPGSCCHQS